MLKLRKPLPTSESERRATYRAIKKLIPEVANAMSLHCSDMAKVTESHGITSTRYIKLWKICGLPGLTKMGLSLWLSHNGKTSKLYLFNESTGEWNRADIIHRDLKAMHRLHDRLEDMMANALHFGIRDKVPSY